MERVGPRLLFVAQMLCLFQAGETNGDFLTATCIFVLKHLHFYVTVCTYVL